MSTLATNPATVSTSDTFLAAAREWAGLPRPIGIEYNIPATLLILEQKPRVMNEAEELVWLRRFKKSAVDLAEEGMLQLALLNLHLNPGSSFITLAFQAGWRYRIGQGFSKEVK